MRPYLHASLFMAVISAFTAAGSAAAKPNPQSNSKATMQMPMVAPLFIEDGEFTSSLVLVNGSAVATYADVSLRSLDGTTVATQRVQFQPFSQRQVSIRDLRNAGTAPGITSGSVTVMQSPSLSGMVIVAALSITQTSSPYDHYIDQELAMPSTEDSNLLRGVANSSDGSPLVAITSLSDMPQHVSITCLGGSSASASKTVTLSPQETLLTQACSPDVNHGEDFDAIGANLRDTPHSEAGIALTSDGMPGSFAAFGLSPHSPHGQRYYSSVPFSDPMMLKSTTAIFTGVPVGTSPLLPDGNYIPRLTVANFSAQTRNVKVQYAHVENGTPTAATVATVTLPSLTSKEIALPGLQGDPMLQDSFMVQSDGTPGDVIARLASTGGAALPEVELLGKDLNDPTNGGDHPWSVQSGDRATLLLFNNSQQPQYFNVEISAGTTVWRKAYQLQPMQTEAISINDLIRTGAKDDKGKALPTDIWSGQVAWHMPARNAGRGRLLLSNRDLGMARNFSCGYIAELCEADYAGYVSFVVDGQTVSYGEIDTQVCLNTCYGTPAGPGGSGYSYGWSSENSNIASISGSNSDYNVSIYGASPGTTYLDGWAADSYCVQDAPSQPAPVVTPTYFFSPSEASASPPPDCTNSGATGYFIDVSWYVADQSSNRVSQSGMTPQENVGAGFKTFANPSTTAGDGSFHDTPYGSCFVTTGHLCAAENPRSFQLLWNGSTYGINTTTTGKDCTDGIQLVIQGNPSTQNKTYTLGNTQ